MVILSKGCKPDNFNFDKSLKLNSANIQGRRSNFVECEFFLKLSWHCCSMWDKLGWLKWFWQFFCKGIGYLPLIWKDSISPMHGLAVYVKEGLPFAQDLSLENYVGSYVFN